MEGYYEKVKIIESNDGIGDSLEAACSGSGTTETTQAPESTTAAPVETTTAVPTEPETTEAPTEAAGPVTYDAKGGGYGGELNLKVTIEGDTIKELELGDHHETNVVMDRAFPIIRERILEANSPVVDSVTAATFSRQDWKWRASPWQLQDPKKRQKP